MHPQGAMNPVPARIARKRAEPQESAEALLEKMRSLLGDCRYQEAQRLAREAAIRFPGHPDVAGMNRALNEWAATSHPATGVDRSEETDWMRQDPPDSLRGKIVALVGAEIVATADSMAELGRQLRSLSLPKRPLVFRVAQ